MNKVTKFTVFVLCLLIGSLASAASLTVGQAIDLKAGLTALDGAQQVVPQGEQAPAKIVAIPYTFTSDARWKVYTALTALKPVLETFEGARVALIKQLGIEPDEKDPAKLAKFTEALNTDLKRPVDLKLPTLTRADLNLDKNQIPGSILQLLSPILKD